MSITKAGNEGKNQAISSCEYLEERFWECSKKEGVVFATNVETLGGGLEKEKQRSWGRRRRRKESSAMRDVRLSGKNQSGLPEKLHEDWCEEVVEDGFGPCDSMERTSRWHRSYRKAEVEEADGGSSSRQEGVGIAFPLFLEVNILKVEEELSTMATLAWTEGVWIGKIEKQQLKALEEADL